MRVPSRLPRLPARMSHALPTASAPCPSLSPRLRRALDVLGASVALLLSAPLFAAIAWLIRRDSRGPVFFRQTRLGQGMRPFTLLKFRTMSAGTPADAHRAYIAAEMAGSAAPEAGLFKLERTDAVTGVGVWLRRTSLDELPQLLNVLRGDMSFVGPRPCIPYETDYFEPHHFERFSVPAGLTGLWQVSGRAELSFREALELDVAYARSRSPALDLRIILKTPKEVLRCRATR